MLLAIDTATRYAGLALHDGDRVVVEMVWQAGYHHSRQVPPVIEEALRCTGTAPADLVAVGVALGPGSFTGLRIGLSLGKGLAWALNIPILGVPTLDITAAPHAGQESVCAIIQAGRGRFAFALYAPADQETWKRLGEYQLGTLDDVMASVHVPTRFVGELSAQERARLREHLGELARFASSAQNVRRPAVLAELAWQRWHSGDVDDPATLSPIYLHVPGA
ncbi:MAG: tRNA (adenosine(37)-N6)-threonylcarbamoyltransferase complex dimerization subunit type 1 TsaB [Ardenticatenia bacterium]|nr:tRNA (adenosine(37)-N6)-threonylcarbamoyltransferase complex dimerization subunit type 1 TsaB [Ardenticatenia bacterium]